MRRLSQDGPSINDGRDYRAQRKEEQRYGLRTGVYKCRGCGNESKECPGRYAVNVLCCYCGRVCDPIEAKTAT